MKISLAIIHHRLFISTFSQSNLSNFVQHVIGDSWATAGHRKYSGTLDKNFMDSLSLLKSEFLVSI